MLNVCHSSTAGKRLCDAYEAVVAKVKQEKAKLLPNLTKSFGFASGIEFREGSLLINAKTQAKVEKGDLLLRSAEQFKRATINKQNRTKTALGFHRTTKGDAKL